MNAAIFDYLIAEYIDRYHTERPHQPLGNVSLTGDWPESQDDPLDIEAIACRTRIGGVLRHYERRMA